MNDFYLYPYLVKSSNYEGLKNYSLNKSKQLYLGSFDDKREYDEICFDDLFLISKAIILGEPGCGKSELTYQVEKSAIEKGIKFERFDLADYREDNRPDYVKMKSREYLNCFFCFDALDEVEENLFPSVIKFILEVLNEYPEASVFITCRNYYVENNMQLIKSFNDFDFILIDIFDDSHIKQYIDKKLTDIAINKALTEKVFTEEGRKLKSILKIPRYLTEICKLIVNGGYDASTILNWKRSDFFEKAIYNKLENEVSSKKNKASMQLPNEVEMSKRILERLALVMELKRTNQISLDEFITFLDDINSNINLSFLANADISVFLERLLKTTGNIIEFDNTEFQEYLAAKELIRLKSRDQVLYDIIVDSDFGHFYANWYDVLRYIVELSPSVLITLGDFLIRQNSNLTDDKFLSLLKGADFSLLSKSERTHLFDIVYKQIKSPSYLYEYSSYLVSLYTETNYYNFEDVIEESETGNNYQIFSQFYISSCLIVKNLFNSDQKESWICIYKKYLVDPINKVAQKAALYALSEVGESALLIEAKDQVYGMGDTKLDRSYLRILGQICPNYDISISLFFDGLKKGYTEAIQELMKVDAMDKIFHIYGKIIGEDDCFEFFFDDNHVVSYLSIVSLFKEKWDEEGHIKDLAFGFLRKTYKNSCYLYSNHKDFIKELLFLLKSKDHNFIFEFINFFDDVWELSENVWAFQLIIFKGQLAEIKSIVDAKKQFLSGDQICVSILSTILNHENTNSHKHEVFEEGRALYPEEYNKWDKRELLNDDKDSDQIKSKIKCLDESILTQCYGIVELYRKYLYLKRTSIDEIKLKLQTAILNVIENVDLTKFKVKRTSQNGYSLSNLRAYYFDQYVLMAIELGLENEIKAKYRERIIYYLPIGYSDCSVDQSNLNKIYELVGELTEDDKDMLYKKIQERNDDYIYLHPTHLFNFVKRYKLENFIPLIEYFIEPSQSDPFLAKEALLVLAEDFAGKDFTFFNDIFKRKKAEDIKSKSLEELSNYFLILKFRNLDAAKWRFEYLKRENNIIEWDLYDYEGSRRVSLEEIELDNPTFCDCFIKSGSPDYIDQFLDLIVFSLNMKTERKYNKYSRYLQIMALSYFKMINRRENVKRIRELTLYKPDDDPALRLFTPLLKEAELYIMEKSEVSNIHTSIDCYNEIKEKKYLLIADEAGLFDIVNTALRNFINMIEYEGLYRPLVDGSMSEKLIQKTLKIGLENELLKLGIRQTDIQRECEFHDDKRIDVYVKYGFIGPIMMELKLLHNPGMRFKEKRTEYKKTLVQYIKGTHAQYSFYLVFYVRPIKDRTNDISIFNEMKEEYSDIEGLKVVFIDCLQHKFDKMRTEELKKNKSLKKVGKGKRNF